MFWWHNSEFLKPGNRGDIEHYKCVKPLFGYENPYTKTTIVFGRRKNLSSFETDFLDKVEGNTCLIKARKDLFHTSQAYHFVLGLPSGVSGDNTNNGGFEDWGLIFYNNGEKFANGVNLTQAKIEEIGGNKKVTLAGYIRYHVFGIKNEDEFTKKLKEGEVGLIISYASGGEVGEQIGHEGKNWID